MLKPLGYNVLVKEVAFSGYSDSGTIILTRPHATNEAQVVSIGPKVTEVAVDDIVILDPKSNNTKVVRHNSETYFLVSEAEIQAVY